MALTRLFVGVVALSVLIAAGPPADVRASDTTSGSAVSAGMINAEKQRFDALIRRYILDHPEVVIESLQAHQARLRAAEQRVMRIAEQVGLDPAWVRAGMDDPGIEQTLQRNFALGRRIKINGTPAFIIGGKLVPGAIDLATMKQLLEAARQS